MTMDAEDVAVTTTIPPVADTATDDLDAPVPTSGPDAPSEEADRPRSLSRWTVDDYGSLIGSAFAG